MKNTTFCVKNRFILYHERIYRTTSSALCQQSLFICLCKTHTTGTSSGRKNAPPAGGAALLGYMIVLSAAAFTIWTALLGRFPVGRVSLFGFLIPVFGAVFSALVLGENIMTVRNLLSLLLVSGGIALANSAAASSKS